MNWAMRQGEQLSKFPLNDPEHRTCVFRNVCFVNGDLTYFVTGFHRLNVPIDYLPEGFNGRMTHVGHLRGFTKTVKTVVGTIPTSYEWSNKSLTFFDANSWSFNYGHYLIDNVIPAFAAAKLFNLKFVNTQQIFETKCRLFTTLEEAFSQRAVDYNRSLGTYQDTCLKHIDGFAKYFFDSSPLYLDEMEGKSLCFKKLFTGQGSTFGLKSVGNYNMCSSS
jgi:hypothetical protein